MVDVNIYIEEVKHKGQVCPMPILWNEFYKTFNVDSNMLAPLILAGWHHSSDRDKTNRLQEQLKAISDEQLRIEAIEFLNNLAETDWYKG